MINGMDIDKGEIIHAFDTHAHLDDDRFGGELDDVTERARNVGVDYIISVGADAESSRKAVTIARKNENVFASVGFHPHDVSRLDNDCLRILRELAGSPKVIAIGEVGLDYYRNHSPEDAQKDAFRAQLKIASEMKLPVILHNREATEDCLSILRDFKGLPGVAHCFSGDDNDARTFLDLGFYISFAGNVTYKRADNLRRAAMAVPADRLLVETDCPWLAPQAKRGKHNEPSYLIYTLRTLAEVRGQPIEDLARLTTENALRFFGISHQ